MYLLHVSVNTGGGESLEVTCCTQLESATADVTIVLSTVVAIKPFANTTPIHTKRAKALQHSNSTDLTTDITSIDSQQLVSNQLSSKLQFQICQFDWSFSCKSIGCIPQISIQISFQPRLQFANKPNMLTFRPLH